MPRARPPEKEEIEEFLANARSLWKNMAYIQCGVNLISSTAIFFIKSVNPRDPPLSKEDRAGYGSLAIHMMGESLFGLLAIRSKDERLIKAYVKMNTLTTLLGTSMEYFHFDGALKKGALFKGILQGLFGAIILLMDLSEVVAKSFKT